MSFPTLFSLSFLFLLMISSKCHAQLSKDYYKNSCPDVESIVRTAVDRKMQQTFVTAPATLRLFFHDCFVRVCCLLLSQENEIPALSLTLMSYVLNLFFFFFLGRGRDVMHRWFCFLGITQRRRTIPITFHWPATGSTRLSKQRRQLRVFLVADRKSLVPTSWLWPPGRLWDW